MRLARVCVFCGSSDGTREEYREAARGLGVALAGRGSELVYGGASCGLMGRLADAALDAGGRVVGIIPEFFDDRELLHPRLTEVELVSSLLERKQRMLDRSTCFVALPGGFGTLDELFEVLVLAQIGGHAKPVGILDVGGFYEPLLRWAEGAVEAGFLRAEHLDLMVHASSPEDLLDRLEGHAMPAMPDLISAREP